MISVYLNGRLGNQIFQYVAIRFLSEKYKNNFWIPKNSEESTSFYNMVSRKFQINLENPTETNPHYWIGDRIFDIDFGTCDDNLDIMSGETDLNSIPNNSFLMGFYQTDKYMKNHKDDIYRWLPFKSDLSIKAEKLSHTYPIDNYCYIHFRGTDYKFIDKFYLPKQYYTNSMDYIKSIKPDIKFVVITDDLMEASNFFTEGEDIISNSMEIDFYLLSKSKYTIIPNSSFSWWATWINPNKLLTVAPDRWFNYNTKDGDFYPDGIKTSEFIYIN